MKVHSASGTARGRFGVCGSVIAATAEGGKEGCVRQQMPVNHPLSVGLRPVRTNSDGFNLLSIVATSGTIARVTR